MRLVAAVFVAAVGVDLLTKAWAVGHAGGLLYDDKASRIPSRIVGSLLAIAVAFALTRLAARWGLGRQRGVWIGCTLLVAGILSNGASSVLWSHGVPDFIQMPGGWVWNIADFEIGLGAIGGGLSLVVSALLVYARERTALRRAV